MPPDGSHAVDGFVLWEVSTGKPAKDQNDHFCCIHSNRLHRQEQEKRNNLQSFATAPAFCILPSLRVAAKENLAFLAS